MVGGMAGALDTDSGLELGVGVEGAGGTAEKALPEILPIEGADEGGRCVSAVGGAVTAAAGREVGGK